MWSPSDEPSPPVPCLAMSPALNTLAHQVILPDAANSLTVLLLLFGKYVHTCTTKHEAEEQSSQQHEGSLIPHSFFRSRRKNHSCEKSCEGRARHEARIKGDDREIRTKFKQLKSVD